MSTNGDAQPTPDAAAFDPGPAPDLDRDGYDERFVEQAALAVVQGGEEAVGHLPTVISELYAMYRRRDDELDRLRKVEAGRAALFARLDVRDQLRYFDQDMTTDEIRGFFGGSA